MFRNRNDFFALLSGLVFALAPGTVFANGMRLVSQDGLATARGEAFVATAPGPMPLRTQTGLAQRNLAHLVGRRGRDRCRQNLELEEKSQE